jgi:hypothetical protein
MARTWVSTVLAVSQRRRAIPAVDRRSFSSSATIRQPGHSTVQIDVAVTAWRSRCQYGEHGVGLVL